MTSGRSGKPETVASRATGGKVRTRKCAWCREPFTPERVTQVVCCEGCALRHAARERAKVERIADRARLDELKPLRKILSEAQAVFNAWIRERDKAQPCISCGRFHTGAHDAGHYLSGNARPDLRFDEANVHRQCVPCNHNLSGNLVAYRQGLIVRIGAAEVLRLEAPGPAKKWTRDELAAIKTEYSAKRRALSKSHTEESSVSTTQT